MHRHFRLFILLLVLLAAACQKAPLPPQPEPPPADRSLQEQADAAWDARRFDQSADLYLKLLGEAPLERSLRWQAWERLIRSQLEIGRSDQALLTAEHWAEVEPDVRSTWTWQDVYTRALLAQGRSDDALRSLNALLAEPSLQESVRLNALRRKADILWREKAFTEAVPLYRTLYAACPDEACRRAFETDMEERLAALDGATLSVLAASPEASTGSGFPEDTIRWRAALLRLESDPTSWPTLWPVLQELASNGAWSDREPYVRQLALLESRYGLPRVGLGLLLPLTGNYEDIGRRVLAGAAAGLEVLRASGVSVEIYAINVGEPDWMERLRGLPRDVRIIGGPLRYDVLSEAVRQNAARGRALFAFMPSLKELTEGVQAWRFFSSPRDQVRAVLDMAVGNLGLTSLGAMYPEDAFGQGMSRYFWEEAVQHGRTVDVVQPFAPNDDRSWPGDVKRLLSSAGRSNSARGPSPQALFLPDGLVRSMQILPQFFFQNEDRILFLGTELWPQSWNDDVSTEANYFALSLMPASWWPGDDRPGARLLGDAFSSSAADQPDHIDLWTALGFDFVRFFGTFGFDGSTEGLNAALSHSRAFEWSMAPLSWNEFGVAAQAMHLLTVDGAGRLIPADEQLLRSRLDQAYRRFARRAGKKSPTP